MSNNQNKFQKNQCINSHRKLIIHKFKDKVIIKNKH